MSYINEYIAKCPAYGWQGGPKFKTVIVTMANGRERRNADNAEARHAFSVPFKNVKRADYANIKQMHLVCRGQLHAFRFKDQLDHEAVNEVFDTGNGARTVFQLRKLSTVDGVSYARNCYAIKTAAITVNGVASAPTIDYRRGTVTFVGAPANGAALRWTGEFDVWVRFNQDDLPFSLDAGNARGEKFINGSVDLIEVPPPGAGE